eukprot:1094005-Pelagomonas_calceolata.AAC.2
MERRVLMLWRTATSGYAGAPRLVTDTCQPDSRLARAMPLANRLDSAYDVHECWTPALNW